MADAFLENLVGFEADRVQEALGFEVIVNLRRGEGGIARKYSRTFRPL